MMKEYLQWISTADYSTINSFVEEATRIGISKRVINYRMAAKLARDKGIVYLVHNNGQFSHCFACSVAQECPFCKGRYEICGMCKGLGTVEKASGGYAVVDGIRWHYTKYIKLRRQIKHDFWKDEHKIGAVSPCKICGGKGRIPIGHIFGFFIPSSIIYIMNGDEDEKLLDTYENAGIKIIFMQSEDKRLCGFKQPYSFYAVSENDLFSISIGDGYNVDNLRREIDIFSERIENVGKTVFFDRPRLYNKKLHRGLKKVTFDELFG